jgi:hypothetical protein
MSPVVRALRALTVLFVVSLVLSPSFADAAGGQKTFRALRAAGRAAGRAVTHPIPVYPGAKLRFNIAPVVKKGDTKTGAIVGVVSAFSETKAHAVGGILAQSEHGSAAGGLVGIGAKGGASFGIAGGKDAVGGVFAVGERFAASPLFAYASKGLAVAGLFGFSRKVAAALYVASGDEAAYGGVFAQGPKGSVGGVVGFDDITNPTRSSLDGRYGLINGLRAFIKFLP